MPRLLSLCPAPVLAVVLLAGAGCTPRPETATSRSSAAAAASCRASTESSFNRQNRYLLSERDTTDAPFSTSGVTGITTRGLTQRYDYDTQLASCLSESGNNGAGVVTQPGPPSGTPVAPY